MGRLGLRQWRGRHHKHMSHDSAEKPANTAGCVWAMPKFN
jgi:hypothetical protein